MQIGCKFLNEQRKSLSRLTLGDGQRGQRANVFLMLFSSYFSHMLIVGILCRFFPMQKEHLC